MRKTPTNNLNQDVFNFFPTLSKWPEGYADDLSSVGGTLWKNVYGFDIETEGLNPYDTKFRIISVAASPEPEIAFSSYCLNGFLESDFKLLKNLLENPEIVLVGHNIKYDINWIRIKFPEINIQCMLFDTMFAQYLLDENIESNSLGNLVKKYVPELNGYKEEINRSDLKLASRDDVLIYNCKDADASRRLYDVLVPKLKKNKLEKLMITSSMVLPVLSKMETRGVYLDKEWANKTQQKLFNDAVDSRYYLSEIAKTSVDPDSSKSLAQVLYKVFGFTPTKYTDTGLPSTDSEAIGYLVDQCKSEAQHKFIDSLLGYKKKIKLLTTYYQPIEKWTKYDGRVHTNYSLGKQRNEEGSGGTVTGRLSSNNPNLQNIPRGKEHRGMFAASEGHTFLDGDFCVSPETKILKSDLTWIPAKELKINDELIGFEEFANGRDRVFQASKVVSIKLLKQPCYEIFTTKGKVISSNKHRWLAREYRGSYHKVREYIPTEELKTFDEICFFHKPWEVDESKEAYYLRGFFDGEGWLSEHMVGYGQNPGTTFDYVSQLLKDKGFNFTLSKKKVKCLEERITQSANTAEFIGSIRPPRLLAKSKCIWENKSNWGSLSEGAKIISIKFIGEQEVVGIETETKTYIANGFLSHNSQLELRVAAYLSQEPVMLDAFHNGLDIHTAVMSDLQGIPYDDLVKLLKEPSHPEYEKTKNDRVAIKRINFGILYGVQAQRLQRLLRIELGITVDLDYCEDIIKKWLSRYAKIREWIKLQKLYAVNYGFVSMPLGQRRRLPEANFDTGEGRRALRQATNFPVQSFASWICLIGLILQDQYFKDNPELDGHIVMQVHDSVTSEVKLLNSEGNLTDLSSIKEDISKIMEKETLAYIKDIFGVDFNCPLSFPVEIVERWK